MDDLDPTLSNSQPACAHCREKKTRCGREVPKCASCQRDGVSCIYSSPSKRVNHIKLLCNNVGGLEDRLSNIEEKLSDLTTSLTMMNTRTSSHGSDSHDSDSEESSSSSFDNQQISKASAEPLLTRSHILRGHGGLLDRYQGPWTLLALCREFYESALSDQPLNCPSNELELQLSSKSENSAMIQALRDALTEMCVEAGTEDSFDLQLDQSRIQLPPKQFLSMVQSQFFNQVDYTTDVFVQSYFWSNVEPIYSRGSVLNNEAWAICLNLIILLVTRSDITGLSTEPLIQAQFKRSLFTTIRAALSNPRVMTAPKLINVQALSLLSVAAQQYCSPGLTESIFAQACVLARMIGLHQNQAASDSIGTEEAQERYKVFRSLYIRDKSFSISRGSTCWLPSFDCSFLSDPIQSAFISASPPSSSSFTTTSIKWVARIQLARMQEEIYQHFHLPDLQNQSKVKYKSSLSCVRQRLDQWAKVFDIFTWSRPESSDFVLQLEFLSASIATLHSSSRTSHIKRLLKHAKASCLLLLVACGKHDQFMVDRLENLSLPRKSSKPSCQDTNLNPGDQPSSREFPIFSAPLLSQNLLDAFPVSAFFLLVKNMIWPNLEIDDTQGQEDISLLRMICSCYDEFDGNVQASTYVHKVAQVFNRLLKVVDMIKNYKLHSASSDKGDHSSNNRTLAQNIFGGPQDLSDFADAQFESRLPTPQLWDYLLVDNSPKKTSDVMSATSSASFTTSPGADLFGKSFNHFQQPFDANFQLQSIPLSSRKRARLNKHDILTENNY